MAIQIKEFVGFFEQEGKDQKDNPKKKETKQSKNKKPSK